MTSWVDYCAGACAFAALELLQPATSVLLRLVFFLAGTGVCWYFLRRR